VSLRVKFDGGAQRNLRCDHSPSHASTRLWPYPVVVRAAVLLRGGGRTLFLAARRLRCLRPWLAFRSIYLCGGLRGDVVRISTAGGACGGACRPARALLRDWDRSCPHGRLAWTDWSSMCRSAAMRSGTLSRLLSGSAAPRRGQLALNWANIRANPMRWPSSGLVLLGRRVAIALARGLARRASPRCFAHRALLTPSSPGSQLSSRCLRSPAAKPGRSSNGLVMSVVPQLRVSRRCSLVGHDSPSLRPFLSLCARGALLQCAYPCPKCDKGYIKLRHHLCPCDQVRERCVRLGGSCCRPGMPESVARAKDDLHVF
jgi:hypothetical protein